MTVARQMAINDSPDKLEINYPGDNPMEVNENFSQQFQSDINVEAIESINTAENQRNWLYPILKIIVVGTGQKC